MTVSTAILQRCLLVLFLGLGLEAAAQVSTGPATPVKTVVGRQTIVGTSTKPVYDLNGNLIVGAPSGRLEMRLQDRLRSERMDNQRLVSQELLRDRREAKIAEIRLDEGEGSTVVLDPPITGVTTEQREQIRRKVNTQLILRFNE